MPALEVPQIDYTVILQALIVLGWGVALLLIDLGIPQERKRLTGLLALAGLLVAAAAGPAVAGEPRSSFSAMLRLDSFSLAFTLIFLAAAAITILLSLDYLPRQGIIGGEYYVLILFAVGGMILLAQGTDLIVLFLGLELLSITLYVLTGVAYPRAGAEEGGMKYLLIGAFAAGFLVFGIALVYGASGTTNLQAINAFLSRPTLRAEDYTLLLIGAGLIMVGFGYKISMVPFHMWTPDVYEGAPTPVTAFMSVATKAAGFAALTRFLLEALPTQTALWMPAVGVLAALTMLVGNIAAITQQNVKRMLAYSSIGQAGYMLLGPLAGGERGVPALVFYLVAYAATNMVAFGVLVALERRGEESWSMGDLAGLWQRHPWLASLMALCMLSLAGVPPTAGFMAKLFIFAAAINAGLLWLVLIGVIASGIAAVFYLRVIAQMFMRRGDRDTQPALSPGLDLGLGLAAAGIVLLGILPGVLLSLVQQSAMALGR
jgi:NADH-quinone oxidoreductase subunit N